MRLNDLELNFTDRGEGLPIVLLHGLALDNRIWNHVIETYASQARFIPRICAGTGKHPLGRQTQRLARSRMICWHL